MSFQIKGKVAIISGGASGLGLQYGKELLKNGLRGVTLADVNEELGSRALEEIQNEFGPNKAIFVQTDVTNKTSFEDAFKKNIETYKNLDILINNAGLFDDSIWEKEIAVNLNGVIHGVLLGLETYIPKYKTDSEGVIVNISSTSGVEPNNPFPVYTATKFAVRGMSMAFGNEAHYNRTNVKVLTLCPGYTETPLATKIPKGTLGLPYQAMLNPSSTSSPMQKPKSVALALVQIIENAKSGTVWVAEFDQKPYEYISPTRQSFAPK